MIPWPIVHLVGAIASLFGFDLYVRAWSGNRWGVERIHFMRRLPGAQKLRRLAPYKPGAVLTPIEPYPPFARPTDPAPDAWPS